MTAQRRKTDRQDTRLTAAQRTGDEPIMLSDGSGRWYYAACDDDGNVVTDPAHCDIWEKDADGRDVMWKPAVVSAGWLGITPRWLRLLEPRGLPARGHRDSCEYPWPHVGVWFAQYQTLRHAGDNPLRSTKRLSMAEAWARHDRQRKIEEAHIDYRIATDALYAKYMAASEKNDPRLALRFLEQLWARDGRPESWHPKARA